MKVRFLQPGDLIPDELLVQLGERTIQPGDNVVVAIDEHNHIHGVLSSRPVQFITGFAVINNFLPVAEDLVDFGVFWLRSQGCPEALYVCDELNERFRRFMKDRGAIESSVGVISRLKIGDSECGITRRTLTLQKKKSTLLRM